MGTLTKYNALVGELEPYTPSRLALQKALADMKISDWDSEYNANTDQRTIAIAAIKVLKRMIVLTNDTLGKSSQGYSVEKSFFAFREIRTLNLRCTYQKQINVCSKAVYKNNA